jgi:hypothetical protein
VNELGHSVPESGAVVMRLENDRPRPLEVVLETNQFVIELNQVVSGPNQVAPESRHARPESIAVVPESEDDRFGVQRSQTRWVQYASGLAAARVVWSSVVPTP